MIAHLHRAVVGAALLFSATTSSQAEQPVSVGTKGELRVVYSFNAVGEKVLGSDLSEKWNNRMVVAMTFQLQAEPPREISAIDGPTKQQLSKMKAASKQGQTLAKNAGQEGAPLMQDMEAILEKCGEDEACIQSAAMAMVQQPKNKKKIDALNNVVDESKKIDTDLGPKVFQPWKATSQSVTYELSESFSKDEHFITCPGERCKSSGKLSGKGKLPGLKDVSAGNHVIETHLAKNNMKLIFPTAMNPIILVETVQSNDPDANVFKGKRKVKRMISDLLIDNNSIEVKPVTQTCGPCTRLKGAKSANVELNGRRGKVTITWNFELN